MCSSREDFDGFESVTGDIGEMLAGQPAFVEEMRGDAEAMIRQPPILTWLVRAAVAPDATRNPPHVPPTYVGRVPRSRRCHGFADPATAIPPDAPPGVPAVARTGGSAPGCRARRSASGECIECKPCCDVRLSETQTCRAPSGFAAAPSGRSGA